MPQTPRSGLARVNGVQLAYQIHGAGDPLVLLHGGLGSVEMFGPNVPALAAGRMVVGVDLQSHGRTPAVDRPMRFETMADDVAALVHDLGLARADVMGFSLGGGVALRTAMQHPDVVRRLVLVSTPLRRAGWHPEMVAAFDQMGPELAEPFKQSPMYEVVPADRAECGGLAGAGYPGHRVAEAGHRVERRGALSPDAGADRGG